MSEELYFNDELRKCLNAAGLSDCGENDAWNYWYHRVHKAHDQAVDRVTEAQRVENARLRKLSSIMLKCIMANERKALICWECPMHKQFDELRSYCCLEHEASELGIEVTK